MDTSCFKEATTAFTTVMCISSGSSPVYLLAYYALCFLIIVGWSMVQGVKMGLAIGGFLCTLIGTTLFFAGMIPIIAPLSIAGVTMFVLFLIFLDKNSA